MVINALLANVHAKKAEKFWFRKPSTDCDFYFSKNPNAEKLGQIYFHDIGDYLNREHKLEIIKNFQSVNGISAQNGWTQIIPDQFNDWLNQRDRILILIYQWVIKKIKYGNNFLGVTQMGL